MSKKVYPGFRLVGWGSLKMRSERELIERCYDQAKARYVTESHIVEPAEDNPAKADTSTSMPGLVPAEADFDAWESEFLQDAAPAVREDSDDRMLTPIAAVFHGISLWGFDEQAVVTGNLNPETFLGEVQIHLNPIKRMRAGQKLPKIHLRYREQDWVATLSTQGTARFKDVPLDPESIADLKIYWVAPQLPHDR